ncbi:hypothetical protein DENSPDRAFT_846173 [Dentipellis sp. KUC8613]|nr:hypothetical protein DENSPDRAFT_846173 [Dentipellis sp. KUC8613]
MLAGPPSRVLPHAFLCAIGCTLARCCPPARAPSLVRCFMLGTPISLRHARAVRALALSPCAPSHCRHLPRPRALVTPSGAASTPSLRANLPPLPLCTFALLLSCALVAPPCSSAPPSLVPAAMLPSAVPSRAVACPISHRWCCVAPHNAVL